MFSHTQTQCGITHKYRHTHTHTLDHKKKVAGYKNRRDYAARHQREPNSSVFLHISQVACSDEGEPLAFSF